MDSSLMRGSSLAATYPRLNPRVRSAPAKNAASDGDRRAAAFREHAPVYVRHPDKESLWRKGRLLVCDRPTGRCRCLVDSAVGEHRGGMTEEVIVSGDAVFARDINQPDADVDNLMSGIAADNDAAIVNLLRARYEHDGDKRIYTGCGADMILSINPWEALNPGSLTRADLGTGERAAAAAPPAVAAAAAWHAERRDAPHVWTLASAAIQGLRRCGGRRAHTICACGVSGSGKSNASELALSYFAGALEWDGNGADALVCTRDVLESFGCAGTRRNPRSSRFTRMVEVLLHLLPGGETRVLGAQIDAFMLERSRVHRVHPEPETNFLVFEQLRAASSESPFGSLLPAAAVEDSRRSEEFETLVAGLEKLGMPAETLQSVFRVVAGVQELSQLSFGASSADEGTALSFDSSRVADLLGCPNSTLHELLGSRRIGSVNDSATVVVNFNAKQARRSCNELAKSLYARLFAWLGRFMNGSMSPSGHSQPDPAAADEEFSFHHSESGVVGIVNVLDLPGLDTASGSAGLGFDQLCSNYADERLHHVFLRCAVSKVQSDYLKEGLRWEPIDYPDNGPIVTAMEKIFELLEDQHKRGKHGSDAHFLEALQIHVRHSRNVRSGKAAKVAKAPKPTVAEADEANILSISRVAGKGHFTVRHYNREEILYSARGFREQNEDVAHADVVELALADCCQDPFIAELLSDGRPTNARQQHQLSGRLLDARHSPTKRGLLPLDSFGSSMSSINSLIVSRDGLDAFNSTGAVDGVRPRVQSVSLSRNGVDREVSPRQTLLAAHRTRIDILCDALTKSKLHYVRCLVPNLDQDPSVFSERAVHEQLESKGVLQAIRVRRRGYPRRMSNRTVLSQYWLRTRDMYSNKI